MRFNLSSLMNGLDCPTVRIVEGGSWTDLPIHIIMGRRQRYGSKRKIEGEENNAQLG